MEPPDYPAHRSFRWISQSSYHPTEHSHRYKNPPFPPPSRVSEQQNYQFIQNTSLACTPTNSCVTAFAELRHHRLVPNDLRTPTVAYRPQGPLLPRSATPR